MQIIDLEQGSDEWKRYRLGKITGTRLGSIWSSREYTKADIEAMFVARGFDFVEFQKKFNEARKEQGLKSKAYTKADLEELLTEADRDELRSDKEKKIEYYQLLADQVAVEQGDEQFEGDNGELFSYDSMMDRGTGLEATACNLAASILDKRIFEVGCCASEEESRVIQSPDRLIIPDKFKGSAIATLIERVNSGKLKITEAMEAKCLASAKHLMAFFERQIPEDYWTQKVQYFAVNEHLQTLYWVFYDPRIKMLPIFILVVHREDLGHWPETMLKYQKRTMVEHDKLLNRLFVESENIILPAKAEKAGENGKRD